jgi:hypothetical protein
MDRQTDKQDKGDTGDKDDKKDTSARRDRCVRQNFIQNRQRWQESGTKVIRRDRNTTDRHIGDIET